MSMKKLLPLVLVAVAMLFAGSVWANVPAPPVNQTIGMPDTDFNALTESDCRQCHDSGVPDRHHMIYGSAIPVGQCSENTGNCVGSGNPCVTGADCTDPADNGTCNDNPIGPCLTDAECATPLNLCNIRGQACPVGLCTDNVTSCTIDDDCPVGETCDAASCPQSYTGQFCGQPFCLGKSAIKDSDANNDGIGDSNYGCLNCHEQTLVGGVIKFIVTRDCLECHDHGPNQPSVHHLDEGVTGAKAGLCKECHGDVVDNKDDGHDIPTYEPSLVTPAVTGETHPQEPGSCAYCHEEGLDTASGVEVLGMHDTHHGSGVYKNRFGGTFDSAICAWCHKLGDPHNHNLDPDAIRTCENCHGYESLHNIQADSLNAGNIGSIVVGAEDAGYGHVGKDNGPSDSDCWGCHGFSIASAPATGPIVPTISNCDKSSIASGKDAVVVLTGSSFTNDSYASIAVLTAADGSSVNITPASISVSSMTVTIPGTTAPGVYKLAAVKSGSASNPVVISVTPAVVITSTVCDEAAGTMTITGSGFGDPPPAGVEDFINVMLDGVSAQIASWSDTQIVISVPNCGDVVVNALLGSASTGAPCEECAADCYKDGKVNSLDLLVLKVDYNRSDCAVNPCSADFNSDGKVNSKDLLIMKQQYSKNNCCVE